MTLMFVVIIFMVKTLRQRMNKPAHFQRYGPLYCVLVAVPLIVADLWRHILQDKTLTVMDPIAIILVVLGVFAAIWSWMVFNEKEWGPFKVPTRVVFRSAFFQHVPMFLFLVAFVLSFTSHLGGWFGATRLDWPECGDNDIFPRYNQTWTSACTWSSSQYLCENYCCVPGDGSKGLLPASVTKNGCTCSCIDDSKEGIKHLSPIGVVFTIMFTYIGFVLLAVGTLWNASIITKLKEVRTQWRMLRGHRQRNSDSAGRHTQRPYDPPQQGIAFKESFQLRDDKNPVDTSESEEHYFGYDVVVIGGGSGGLACSKACKAYNKQVLVLDFVKPSPIGTTWGLGGTCVNVGCIPKKLMHQAGLTGEAIDDAADFGWSHHKKAHTWEKLKENVDAHIKSLNQGYKTQLNELGVEYINGHGVFKDPHTLEVQDAKNNCMKVITARRFVLAMGGRPSYPSIPGALEYGVTSDDIFKLKQDPGKVCVVGGSYVALECAGFLTSLGHDVTVLLRSIPLRGFDQQMAEKIVAYMEMHGTKFVRPAVPVKVTLDGKSKKVVEYTKTDTKTTAIDTFDTVMFAVGRQPCTDIGLDKAGVRLNSEKKVVVSKWDRTTMPHIYAIGDIQAGGLELTPVAIQAGRLLADRLFGGLQTPMDYVNVPTTVFTPLEYGCCGLSEEAAIGQYGEDNIEVYHSEMTPLEWYLPHRKATCYIKLVCNALEDFKVVGFHILSPNAGEVTQGVGVAMKAGATKKTFDSTIGIHPTVAEEMTTLKVTKRSAVSAAKGGC